MLRLLLLPCGAVVDAVDADGNTPLMLAAENGQCAALQLLLDRCEPVVYIPAPYTDTVPFPVYAPSSVFSNAHLILSDHSLIPISSLSCPCHTW